MAISSLRQLATFDYGQDKETLDVVDEAVIVAHDDPALQALLEDIFVNILQSDAELASKRYVCRKLMHMGTERSVPVLAKLLDDPDLAHMASV